MPELAEVTFYSKQWAAGERSVVTQVIQNPRARVFRGEAEAHVFQNLEGKRLVERLQHGKQMLFKFSSKVWLGVHLGMTGKLSCIRNLSDFSPKSHDHLVLLQKKRALVFTDSRMFGRVRYHQGTDPPEWWQSLPPPILSSSWSLGHVQGFLRRRQKSPVKTLLLDQGVFPGIGNWMADEILWQARIHPLSRPADLSSGQVQRLHESTQAVVQGALDTIGRDYREPPENWLFRHRWKDGGHCPVTGEPLESDKIGGRRTVWCPSIQQL